MKRCEDAGSWARRMRVTISPTRRSCEAQPSIDDRQVRELATSWWIAHGDSHPTDGQRHAWEKRTGHRARATIVWKSVQSSEMRPSGRVSSTPTCRPRISGRGAGRRVTGAAVLSENSGPLRPGISAGTGACYMYFHLMC